MCVDEWIESVVGTFLKSTLLSESLDGSISLSFLGRDLGTRRKLGEEEVTIYYYDRVQGPTSTGRVDYTNHYYF